MIQEQLLFRQLSSVENLTPELVTRIVDTARILGKENPQITGARGYLSKDFGLGFRLSVITVVFGEQTIVFVGKKPKRKTKNPDVEILNTTTGTLYWHKALTVKEAGQILDKINNQD